MSLLHYWKKPAQLHTYNEDPLYLFATDIHKVLGSFLTDPLTDKSVSKNKYFSPRIELKERPTEYVLSAELAGCNKDDVQVSLEDNILSIKGERKFEETKDDEKYHVSERFYGCFERNISLPEGLVDKDRIDASFKDGVLTVSIGKKYKTQNEPKKIDVK